MSRSCVNATDPWTTAATPPTTTKSTSPSTSRVSRARGLNSGSSCTPALDHLVPQLSHVSIPRLEPGEPLVGRKSQRLVQQRLVDARLARHDLEYERSAHGVERALERGDRDLVTGRLQPRDRRLRDPEPAGERRLGESLGLAGLADERTGHRSQTISCIAHERVRHARSRLRGPMNEELERRTRHDPAEAEAGVTERWLESGLFHPEAAGTAAENFSIAIPLPNVTGALHMGH